MSCSNATPVVSMSTKAAMESVTPTLNLRTSLTPQPSPGSATRVS